MNVELYHRQQCPYSAKVRRFINLNNLKGKVLFHDITDDQLAYDRLMELTHDDQVPCLVVDNKPILESSQIIKWLETNKQSLS